MDSVDWRDMYEERAALMEYDGGLARDSAEVAACAWVRYAWEVYYGTK